MLTVGFLAGCGRKEQKGFERGAVENGVYRNAFFGFSMDVPQGMYIMPEEAMDSVSRAMGSLTGLNRTGESGDTAEKAAELLLFVSREDPAAADSLFNYNIVVTSEKLPSFLGTKNNEQYMSLAIKMLEKSASSQGGRMPAERSQLGGRDFMKLSMGQHGMTQDIYARLQDGYALIIVGSYDGEEQKAAVDRMISTVAFSQE